MRPNQEPENDTSLDRVLKQWVVDDAVPPRFQEGVWKRIADADGRSAMGFWSALVGILESALPRPKVACTYLSALLLLGIAGGSMVAQKQNHRLEASLGSRYLQTIDPYQPGGPSQ